MRLLRAIVTEKSTRKRAAAITPAHFTKLVKWVVCVCVEIAGRGNSAGMDAITESQYVWVLCESGLD